MNATVPSKAVKLLRRAGDQSGLITTTDDLIGHD
jgi:hypothetical protein